MFERLGGKRPALHYYANRAAVTFGAFGAYRQIDWQRVGRIVMVCSGNICRSPYAEAKFRACGVPAVSCGTHAILAAPANESAQRVALRRQTDLSSHSSSPVAALQYSQRDLLLAVEPQHLPHLAGVTSQTGAQVSLLGLWCGTPIPYIPDPYDRSDACFEFVFDLIDEAVARIARRLPKAEGQQ